MALPPRTKAKIMARSSGGSTRRSGEEQSSAGLFHSLISSLENQLLWSEALTGEAPKASAAAMRHRWGIDKGIEEVRMNVNRSARLGRTAPSPRLRSTLLIASDAALFGRGKRVPIGTGKNRFHKKRPRTSGLLRSGWAPNLSKTRSCQIERTSNFA